MSDDEQQCRGAIVHYGCRLGFTKQGERTLDINAAPAAFPFRKIVFEIRIRCPDFIQRMHRFARKRGASEICVNYNSSSVDDRLKSAGAKFIERAAEIIDNRVEFGSRAARTHLRQFAADNFDDERPRQIRMAEGIKNLRDRRNLASLVTPHSVMHINGPRRRRGTIRPISAAEGTPAFRRTVSVPLRFASVTHSNKPPLVCASANRIWHVSSVRAQSTRTVAPLRLSRVPCGTQPRLTSSRIS